MFWYCRAKYFSLSTTYLKNINNPLFCCFKLLVEENKVSKNNLDLSRVMVSVILNEFRKLSIKK